MTVAELIEELQKLPQEHHVVLDDDGQDRNPLEPPRVDERLKEVWL